MSSDISRRDTIVYRTSIAELIGNPFFQWTFAQSCISELFGNVSEWSISIFSVHQSIFTFFFSCSATRFVACAAEVML
jgi:hypothetical protein